MRADKIFYDTLREEVKQEKLSNSLLIYTKTTKKQHVDKTNVSLNESKLDIHLDIKVLQDKIKGLESQVDSLEKRNLELTEKNKDLSARMENMVEMPEFIPPTEEELEEMESMADDEETWAAYYRRGYISIQEIVKWANEGTTNINEARLIKEMIRDINPSLSEEEKEIVRNIGHSYREPNEVIAQTNITNNYEQGSNSQVFNGAVKGQFR
jgi:hypothetical protein